MTLAQHLAREALPCLREICNGDARCAECPAFHRIAVERAIEKAIAEERERTLEACQYEVRLVLDEDLAPTQILLDRIRALADQGRGE